MPYNSLVKADWADDARDEFGKLIVNWNSYEYRPAQVDGKLCLTWGLGKNHYHRGILSLETSPSHDFAIAITNLFGEPEFQLSLETPILPFPREPRIIAGFLNYCDGYRIRIGYHVSGDWVSIVSLSITLLKLHLHGFGASMLYLVSALDVLDGKADSCGILDDIDGQ